jgi:Homocysteine S-methyltransferase
MTQGILERLAQGPVLGDGGYLLELEKRGYVQAGPFTPEVSLTHPEATLPLMREVRAAVPGFVACQPVAYRTPAHHHDFTALPEFPFALDPLQLSREEMATYAVAAREIGIDFIGSCCGSVACHVRAMARALGMLPADARQWKSTTGKPMSAWEYHGQDRDGREDS